MALIISSRVNNGIFASEEDFFHVKKAIQDQFPHIKIIFTTNRIRDITDENEVVFLITDEHERAHRHYFENYQQLQQK